LPSLADLPVTVEKLLAEIQDSLYAKALAFRRLEHAQRPDYDELKKAVENGFAFSGWCGKRRL